MMLSRFFIGFIVGNLATTVCALANDTYPELAEWKSVELAAITDYKLSRDFGCSYSENISPNLSAVSMGTSYNLANYHPNVLQWTAGLIANPSKTVAMREMYAADISIINPNSWNMMVQSANSLGKPPRFSIILKSGGRILGTPLKWDDSVAVNIENLLKSSEDAGFDDNVIAKVYASELLKESLETFGTTPESWPDYSKYISSSLHESCDSQGISENSPVAINISSEIQPEVYLGFSFKPQVEGIEWKPVTTISGAGGERLGTELPSWPFVEK